jgi:U6 snRNA-associated Sm-like protein LSm5
MAGMEILVPLTLMQKCVGSKMVCLLDDGSEVEGFLVSHDSTCTVVLSDATTFRVEKERPTEPNGFTKVRRIPERKFRRLVVNSKHIEVLVPGGVPTN